MIVRFLHPDHPKIYARWPVATIGGEKSVITNAIRKKTQTFLESTAKLSHIANTVPRLARSH